jgi:uncharacterized membrane protein
MTILRRGFIAASVVWAMLLPAATCAASHATPAPFWYALAFVVYGAGSVVCHQLPSRSFYLWAAQMPVCARCTGIYIGAAAAAVVATIRLRQTIRLKPDPTSDTTTYDARVLLAIAALPTALTLIYEWTTGDTPSNAIRALAGVPLGAAVAFVIVKTLRSPVEARP